ncbi:sensor histidine kinase [Streptomyces guryensis]|uniref:histidine kinase n=1 Tax=Streptomyces guryensis TaxID=2886947 RepID=A0A9Q3VS10_9ACTN|nr:ATP-binding protein [Streptomyces guryensis]MCD9876338.1 ATP-binding protein [Streptomyces guryensis]
MSHLRAPAARADRREGGRHGRPVARPVPPLPETHIRPQLLRLAVLPPIAVALSASAAVLFTVRSTGARPGLALWGVLAGAALVALSGILIASVAAQRTARSVSERIGALRRVSARGEADLRALVESLRRGDTPPPRKPRSSPADDADDFELLAADLTRAYDGAVTAVVQAAQLSSQAGSEQKLEVFVNLARRLQSLVHREISILDELENEIEDPDLLKGLFHVDHLATRIRRHAENLAVLGGAVSRRQWSNPVSMTEVLRSAIAEVEQYSRVKLVPPIDGTLRGHAVADVIHLLAELVENATVFSAPHTQVLLRANLVTSGLAVEVEDRGLGMPVGEQKKMNALLADPDQVNVASLLADGRIGLFVVSQLARRHGINVRLQTNIYGGVQAVLVVPQGLLGSPPGVPGGAAQPHGVTGVMGVPAPSVPPRSQPQVPPGPHPEAVGHRVAPPPSAPRGTQPREATPPAAVPNGSALNGGTAGGSGPAPLPVRGAHEERANPAEAVPGVRPDDRRLVAENAATPPTPRTGTVRGTMGKPQLPRRRAQEHIAPQLRDGPAPRQESEYLAAHDPGLMAAFQRGIGLAEAQQNLESEHSEYSESAEYTGAVHTSSAHWEPDWQPEHMASTHVEPTYVESAHVESTHMESAHMESAHPQAPRTESAHMVSEPMGQATRFESRPLTDPAHTEAASILPSSPLDVLHTDVTATSPPPSIDVSHMDPAHIAEARPASARGTDHPTRHDGSAPAG